MHAALIASSEPIIVVIDSRAAVMTALEAVAHGREVALLLPAQIRGPAALPHIPARCLPADAPVRARALLKLPLARWGALELERAAVVLGVACWPAVIAERD